MDARELGNAANSYRRLIRHNPADFNAHIGLGSALYAQGMPQEAERVFRRALQLQPDCAEVYSNLCVVLREQAKLDEAVEAARVCIGMKPGYADAHCNLGNVLRDQKKPVEAASAYREAIRLRPTFAPAYNNLAAVLTDEGNLDEAADAARRAIGLNPNYAEAHLNLGNAMRSLGRLDEAIAAFGRALRLQPDLAEAHANLGLVLLLRGDFQHGLAQYEWRWLKRDFSSPRRNFPQPQWAGNPLKGRTILLHAEQGFGDSIQFVRYVPQVAAAGGNVILECPRALERLFSQLPGPARIVKAGDPLPPFDVHCPLASLPLAFLTRVESIPNHSSYLRAEPELVESWKSLFPQSSKGLRAGLAWAGSSVDRNRSIDPDMLAPLSESPGVTWVSLQADRSPPPGLNCIDVHDRLTDFAQTAALIANLDLVITIDTAVAHLAGAMGKPTFTMIPFAPDWRWLLNREDSPWYPAMRLFRQQAIGQWKPVIERVKKSLAEVRGIF